MKSKLLALHTLTLFSASTLCADYISTDTTSNQQTHMVTTSKSEQPNIRGLASARPEVKDGVDLFLSGDLLIWQTQTESLSYAGLYDLGVNNANTDYASLSLNNGKIKNPDFDYQYGFKVGLGCNLSHDGWDALLAWTWFRDNSHSTTSPKNNQLLFPSLLFAGYSIADILPSATQATSHWKLNLDLLDLEIGREFYAGKWLALRPFFGLRSSWIRQKDNLNYSNISLLGVELNYLSATANFTNNFWGFGPRVGCNGEWQFGSGWSLYGNGAAALQYGYFHLAQNTGAVDTTNTPMTLLNVGNSFHSIKPCVDLEVGLRWDYMFFHDSFHLGLHAGWQQLLFFSQNQMMRFLNLLQPAQFVQNQGDLGFQGWTVGARFDF